MPPQPLEEVRGTSAPSLTEKDRPPQAREAIATRDRAVREVVGSAELTREGIEMLAERRDHRVSARVGQVQAEGGPVGVKGGVADRAHLWGAPGPQVGAQVIQGRADAGERPVDRIAQWLARLFVGPQEPPLDTVDPEQREADPSAHGEQ